MLKINGLYLPMLANRMVSGNVFWVGTTSADRNIDGQDLPSHGGDPRKPFASWDYAIGKCTADNDDLIVLMAGHTETIAVAGEITMDVAGVSVVGMGRGASRPTITFDTNNTATILVTGANCSIENIICYADFEDIAVAIDIDAVDALIKNVSFLEASTHNWDNCIATDDTANECDGLTVTGCERISVDTESLAFISILGNIKRLSVIDNFDSQSSAADVAHFITMGSFVCLNTRIIGNVLNLNGDNNAQAAGIFATSSSTTSTGIMAHNLCGSLDTGSELFDDADCDFQHFENYYTGTIALSGYLLPAADNGS
jgi:hypothetical protein